MTSCDLLCNRAHTNTHAHPPCVFIEVLMVNPVCYFKLCVPLSAIILSSVINCYNLRSININAHVWLPWQWSQCCLAACWQDNRCISTDKWQNQPAEDGRPASMWPPDEPWSGQKLTETQAGIGIIHHRYVTAPLRYGTDPHELTSLQRFMGLTMIHRVTSLWL